MAEFKSWRSFLEFEQAVTRQTRYVHNEETNGFLETVRQTAEARVEVLPAGTLFWRAQLGCDWEPYYKNGMFEFDVPYPLLSDRMKPLRESATEGRANPKGIPFLYLATDRQTAISEVRPWVGSYVSVGLFGTRRDLRVVDCVTTVRLTRAWSEEPSAEHRETAVWIHMDEAFGRPVTPSDRVADYAPTQILAELFRSCHYDGIAYRSSVSNTGHNIVLFDLDAAELGQRCVFEVTGVTYESKQAAGTVYCMNHMADG